MIGSPTAPFTKAIAATAGPIIALILSVVVSGCASGTGGSAQEPVPTTPDALHAWLLADGHGHWTAESAVHATDESGAARVYLSPLLVASLQAGSTSHPIGAAAVRELYESDLMTLQGYAVLVKTEEEGPDGTAWLFYETFETKPGAPHAIAKHGAPGCVGCHQDGVDYVQSQLPLP
jgi:hypothetical protein